MDSEFFSKSIRYAVSSHWLPLVAKMEPVLHPFYLLFYVTFEDFNPIM